MEIEEERRSVPQVLYETRHHASRPYSSSYPPVHQQLNEGAKGGFLRFLSTQGLTEFKEKWTTNKHPQKLSKWISMFISPSGEHVAIAIGNEITILQRDDNYQEPCGIFTCSYPISYTFGAWSEDHGVLGVFDNTDTLYFIKANGEEITRITKQHLKVPLPVISFVIQDDKNAKKSCLCTFSILASDGSVHDIEISQDPSASISTINSSNIDSLLQEKFPQNISCCGSHPDSSLFAVVSNTVSITSTSTISHGTYSISLWKWHRKSGLQQVSSVDFEGLYTKTKGYTDQMSLPKAVFSPQGEYIATLDVRGCLFIYKLDKKHALSPLHYKQENDLKNILDFTWWDDHIIVIATRNGNITMIDIQSGVKILQDDSQYSLPILERVPKLSGCVFILESKNLEPSDLVIFEPVTIERYKQFESVNLQWSLVSFAKRSVEELYDILISGQQFRAALELADRHGLDKDEVLKAQWLCSLQGLSEINKFLAVIKDQDFVLSECLDRVGPTEDAVRGLIAYGINLTNRYVFSDVEDEKGSSNWDFRIARLKMLQYRDRLETFIGINMGRYSAQDYSKFRSLPIQEAAITLAESGKIGALNLLFKRHPFSISPSMLQILSSIPETVPVQTYTQLLPNYTPPHVTPLREQDWVESKKMVNYLTTLPHPDPQIITEPIVKQLSGFTWPSRTEICKWYKDRAREMDMFSGQLDNSLSLIDFACRKGVKELEDFKTLVSYLHDLIYECDDNDVSFSMSLTTWEELSDYEKFKLMLKGYNEENVIKKLRDSAVPFMEKIHGPSDDMADSVDSFLVRWMKEVAMENKIEVCLVVIEEGCDFFRSEGEVADCALRCLYFFTVTDKWSIMEAMLSKLPYLHGSEFDDLKKRLKVAEGHVEAGRLLTFYQVPKPIAFFLEAQSDSKSVKQILRLILSKFIRRQPGRTDNDWANMWRDFQSLQEKAFPFVDLEYMLMEYCRGLLKAGKFSLARNYLKGSGSLVLPTDKAENIVILAAREYFFSASSLSCSEIWKAKECLNILPTSRSVTVESDIIEALTVRLPQLGVTILPLQYRQIKDPMEILKLAITSQPGAYLHVTDLIEIAKLLGLNELSRVHELIAREAAVAGDLQLAFDLSLLMIKKGHAPIWDLCTALARGPALENMDVNSRKHLLGFALSHCDKESIGELLHAWKDLDIVSQCEKVSASNPLVNQNHVPDLSTLKKTLIDVSTYDSDDFMENGKIVSFLNLKLPWLVNVSRYGSGRLYGMVGVMSWLGRNDLGVKDEWIGGVAKMVMEAPVTEEEDVMGCAVLLNLNDAFYGVEVIEEMVKGREDYEEACSIMNLGMIYSLLHNSRGDCQGPQQRRDLLLTKFQEKYSSLSSDERNKIDQAQSSFWREWKLKLEEQKRVADHTRAIEQIVPGIDTSRFLSGDINYMETVIFSFIETIKTEKKKILKDVMKLSSDYGLDQTKVLQKFLSTVFLSDIWTIDEIISELSKFETIILNHPKEIFTTISETIYPSINGQNKRHLSYIYHLLSLTFPLIPQKQDLINTELDTFYTTMEQECLKLQSIKDLDFKNIATLTGPNLARVTNEVYAHVNEETVETLADTMKTLTGIYKDRVPDGLVAYPYVYGYYVSTSLTFLENNAKSNHHFQTPENLKSFIKDLELTYDKCKKYIKLIAYPGASVMGIMKKFFKITPSLNTNFDHLQDPKWKDNLILLLKFWLRLINDLKQFVSSNDLEPKFSPDCVSICLESFVELVNDESIPTNDAWAAIFSYINFGLVGDVYTEILNFCRSMMFSGCRFRSIACVYNSAISKFPLDANLSDEIRRHYEDISDLSHLYLRILETILKDLGNGSHDHKNLYRVLSSLSELEGDLDDLKKVRTVIWERLGRFSDDMEIPSHIRVHMLEVMQFITFTNSTSSIELQENVIPWGNMGISTSNTPKATDSSNRFTNTLIALKSTQLLSKISPNLEVSPTDLSTIETAVSCFLNLSENALSRPHIDVLMAVLGEWEGLFGKLTVKEEVKNPPETPAADWGNDDWDEGWEVDEDLVEKESKKDENTLKIHALHQCWSAIFKKLMSLSQFTDILKIIDASKPKQNGVLLDENSAHDLTQSLLKVDCYLAVKIAVLLPYEKLHLECLTAVEDKLKEGNIPTDYGFLVCLLGSGLIPTITTKPCYKNVYLYLNYLIGSWCKQGEVTVFRRVILPWYLSELVKGEQVMLAGLIVVKIMGLNCSFGLVNVAQVSVRKFLEKFAEKEGEILGDEFEVEFCEGVVNTVAGLRSGVVGLVKEALEVLKYDGKR